MSFGLPIEEAVLHYRIGSRGEHGDLCAQPAPPLVDNTGAADTGAVGAVVGGQFAEAGAHREDGVNRRTGRSWRSRSIAVAWL
ncbi:hypothetical protein ACH4PX_34235 [Streptomyces anulatus]